VSPRQGPETARRPSPFAAIWESLPRDGYRSGEDRWARLSVARVCERDWSNGTGAIAGVTIGRPGVGVIHREEDARPGQDRQWFRRRDHHGHGRCVVDSGL